MKFDEDKRRDEQIAVILARGVDRLRMPSNDDDTKANDDSDKLAKADSRERSEEVQP